MSIYPLMKVLRSLNTFHIPYTRDNKSWKCSPVRKPCSLTSEINTAGLDYVQAAVAIHALDTCTSSATLNVTILLVSICNTNYCWSHWQLQAVLLQQSAQYWGASPCSQSCTFSVHEEAQATAYFQRYPRHTLNGRLHGAISINYWMQRYKRLESLFYYWT